MVEVVVEEEAVIVDVAEVVAVDVVVVVVLTAEAFTFIS